MTTDQDVRELIAAQSAEPNERQALNAVADSVAQALQSEVPYRPEFRASLRRRLVSEAHGRRTPWYRRPVLWGSSAAVAAVVAMFAVGVTLWQPVRELPESRAAVDRVTNSVDRSNSAARKSVDPKLVSRLNLPVLDLPDETVSSVPTATGEAEPTAVQLYMLTNPDGMLFGRIAAGLGFSQGMQAVNGGFQVIEGLRALTMSADGYVTYSDSTPDGAGTQPEMNETTAQPVARQFLEQALLAVPGLDPVVSEIAGQKAYTVTYTPKVENRPVVNARTVVHVTAHGHVSQAAGFVQAREESQGAQPICSATEAVSSAQSRGGAQFSGAADLVYVRTSDSTAVYLQPYWRVFGKTGTGERMVRYVPALTAQ